MRREQLQELGRRRVLAAPGAPSGRPSPECGSGSSVWGAFWSLGVAVAPGREEAIP